MLLQTVFGDSVGETCVEDSSKVAAFKVTLLRFNRRNTLLERRTTCRQELLRIPFKWFTLANKVGTSNLRTG